MADQRNGGIAWTETTWNPTRGCRRVSPGCGGPNNEGGCYAERSGARSCHTGGAYDGLVQLTPRGPRWTGKGRLVEKHLADPLHWRRPRMVFVNSQSDLFFEEFTNEEIAAVFGVMAAAPQHTFQILTKRPKRMWEWFGHIGLAAEVARAGVFRFDTREWCIGHVLRAAAINQGVTMPAYPKPVWPLPNVWIGVSVETQKYADERIPELLRVPAAVRWVSYEPALGPVDFRPYLPCRRCYNEGSVPVAGGGTACPDCFAYWQGSGPGPTARLLDWIVCGGESGPRSRPFDLAWARSTIEQCRAAKIACFTKQVGAKPIEGGRDMRDDFPFGMHPKGEDPSEWPEDLRVREYPEVRHA